MNYIPRHIVQTMQRFAASFPIVLVTGPHQVGKSTALHHSFPDIPYLTFDDPSQQLSVKQDPKTFLNMHQSPRIFDEVQYVPELFPYLKMDVDGRGEQGMYYLTGSQQFSMMQRVSESLAGRIGILQLLGISLRERFGDSLYSPFIPTREFIQERKSPSSCPAPKLWEYIHQGSFPVIVTKQVQAEDYYGSYVKTYLERDVRLLAQVGDELQFLQFLTVVASRTGQLLNYSDLAKEVGITGPTAKRWVSILVSTGLVYLLKPYATNVEKQVVKTPKLYFLDTGLACWLTKWSSAEVLQHGAMAGAMFETFVVSEVLKSFLNAGREPSLFFYRDKEGKEIDLLIEDAHTLYPVEIKKSATPKLDDARNFSVLAQIKGKELGSKVILCSSDVPVLLGQDTYALPVTFV